MIDLIKIPIGIIQAYFYIRKEKPDIIFSKGGFVSFPVVLAGWLNKCQIIMHESDVTPGLSNIISLPFVNSFYTTFKETSNFIPKKYSNKIKYVGPIVSDKIKNGNRLNTLNNLNFLEDKPIILVVGGSLGASSLNKIIRDNLPKLLKQYQIIHICGKNQLKNNIKLQGYAQFEFIQTGLNDIFSSADLVISRAGSNAIFEFLFLSKPMILIPLPSKSSRGEQLENAQSFQKNGFCEIIKDEELSNKGNLLNKIDCVLVNRDKYIEQISNYKFTPISSEDLYLKVISHVE